MGADYKPLRAYHYGCVKRAGMPGFVQIVPVWCGHDVVKITERRVVVATGPCLQDPMGPGRNGRKTMQFDRAAALAGECGRGKWSRWLFGTDYPTESPGETVDLPEFEPWERRLRGEIVADTTRADLEILGIDAGASADDIRHAYRKRALETHPDRGGDVVAFRRVTESYEQLRRVVH